mmetsp:Transcript_17935/g.48734  ORF Transcript_17935/g.48734 Transcript_17935/m.48734 type:complete len:161 (+) Transcript_17935:160-642(+)
MASVIPQASAKNRCTKIYQLVALVGQGPACTLIFAQESNCPENFLSVVHCVARRKASLLGEPVADEFRSPQIPGTKIPPSLSYGYYGTLVVPPLTSSLTGSQLVGRPLPNTLVVLFVEKIPPLLRLRPNAHPILGQIKLRLDVWPLQILRCWGCGSLFYH